MVTLVNPGNPTGVMIPRATIAAFSELCAEFGVWLVLDNTYEHFCYAGEAEHSCLEVRVRVRVRVRVSVRVSVRVRVGVRGASQCPGRCGSGRRRQRPRARGRAAPG